jgi:hypothetical protein
MFFRATRPVGVRYSDPRKGTGIGSCVNTDLASRSGLHSAGVAQMLSPSGAWPCSGFPADSRGTQRSWTAPNFLSGINCRGGFENYSYSFPP